MKIAEIAEEITNKLRLIESSKTLNTIRLPNKKITYRFYNPKAVASGRLIKIKYISNRDIEYKVTKKFGELYLKWLKNNVGTHLNLIEQYGEQ